MPGLASNYLLAKLNSDDFNAESPTILKIIEKWPYETFRRRCEESMDPGTLLRILDSLPPALTAEMHRGFAAIDRLSAQGLRSLSSLLPSAVIEQAASDFNRPVEEWENRMWEKLKDRGFIRTCFGPPSFTRRTDLYINQFAAKLAGLPREKVLERMWRRDGPMMMTELDTLCHLLEDMVQMLEVSSTRYLRWAESWHDLSSATLVVQTTEKQLHFSGKTMQLKEVFRVVTADEFDAEVGKQPSARPFGAALHDTRPASQLILDFSRDRAQSLSQLQQTQHGAQLLDRIAQEAHRRFTPLVEAARRLDDAGGGKEASAEGRDSSSSSSSGGKAAAAAGGVPSACASLVCAWPPPAPATAPLSASVLVQPALPAAGSPSHPRPPIPPTAPHHDPSPAAFQREASSTEAWQADAGQLAAVTKLVGLSPVTHSTQLLGANLKTPGLGPLPLTASACMPVVSAAAAVPSMHTGPGPAATGGSGGVHVSDPEPTTSSPMTITTAQGGCGE